MMRRAAHSRHGQRHDLLAGCLLLSLLLHAALLARWQAPVTAAVTPGAHALRVTLSPVDNTATAAETVRPSAVPPVRPEQSRRPHPARPAGAAADLTARAAVPAADPLAPGGEAVASVAHPDVSTEQRESVPDATPPATGGTGRTAMTPAAKDHHAGAIAAAVQLELARHFHYPPLAARRGWQGQVVLAFRVGVDGDIEAVHVAHSSGHALLDRAALGALGRVHKVALERGPLRAPLELQLPVIYRLEES